MWYVIRTKSGFESELVRRLKDSLDEGLYREFLIPMFEDVLRTGGESCISLRRIFPGYVLIDTDKPDSILTPHTRKRIQKYVRLLGIEGQDEDRFIESVNEEDMLFLKSILENGVMSVSFVERGKGTKIKKIIGPLAKYGNRITRLEYRCRRAIVEAEVFGRQRKIKFGIWTEEDPEIPWIVSALKNNDKPEYILDGYDLGIHPGDRVRDVSGTYPDEVFMVHKVLGLTRKIRTKILLFGEMRNIELPLDQVEKV